VELAPRLDRASTQFWIGRALEESGDLEGARRRYSLARKGDPSWDAPGIALIGLEQRRGDWHAVATLARGLLKKKSGEIAIWSALVEALAQVSQGEVAENIATDAIKLFPDESEPQRLLASALRAQGKTDEALAALTAAVEQGGATSQLAAARIRTFGMGGLLEEGVSEARAAVAEYPESAEVQAALASLLFAGGAAEEGARVTDRALALAPDEPSPLRDRCNSYASTGNWGGARDDCTRYLETRTEDAEVTFIRGVALDQLGEKATAVVAYRLAEANPYVMDTLGALYLEKGLVARAISVLEDAHQGAPDLPDASFHLGLAYLEAGRTSEARTLLAAAFASKHASPTLRASAKESLDSLP
jgi:Flp pilus assembly protein TadD